MALFFSLNLTFPLTGFATDDTTWQGDWNYSTNTSAKTITLTKYNGTEEAYKVPATAVIGGETYQVIFGTGSGQTSSIKNLSVEEGVKITRAGSLFYGNTTIETVDLSGADMSSVTDMSSMFSGCTNLSSVNLSGISTPNVTTLMYMFYNCSSLKTVDMSSMDLSKVTNVRYMFRNAYAVEEVDFSDTDMSSVTSFAYSSPSNSYASTLFMGMDNLRKVNFNNFNTASLTTAERMFTINISSYQNSNHIEEIDVTNWNIENVNNLYEAFKYCGYNNDITITGLETLNVENVTNFQSVFSGGKNIKDLSGVKEWNTENAIRFNNLFSECESITELDLSKWDTSKVTDLREIFQNCKSLTDVDVSTWDTSKVTQMNEAFRGCASLETLDLSSWTTDSLVSYGMPEFLGARYPGEEYPLTPLKEITLNENFTFVTGTLSPYLRGGYWQLKEGTDEQTGKKYATGRLYTQYNARKTPDFEDGYSYSHTWVLAELDPTEAQYYAQGIGQENVWEVHYPDDKFKGYCINLHRGAPNGYYDRTKVSGNQIIDDGYLDSDDYGWEPLGNDMEEALITLIYYGWGNDADGIQEKYGLTDDEFMSMTQTAIWDMTDRYNNVGERNWSGNAAKAYEELMSKRFSNIPNGNQLTLYLYESVDGRQNILSISGLNDQAYAGVRVLKMADVGDTAAEPLLGAEFTIYNADDETVGKIVSGDDGYATKYNTDSVYGLPEGTYTIRETKVPRGYRNGSDWYTFIVRPEDDNTIITVGKYQGEGSDMGMVFSNTEDTNVQGGGIEIKKTDDEGNPLMGAKFEITGEEIGQAIELTTGVDGTARTGNKDLPFGDYTVKEEEAPEGYKIGSAEKSVTVSANKTYETVSFEDPLKNGKVSIEATKKYNDTLKGDDFTFELVDDLTDEVVATAKNDKDGKISFELGYSGKDLGYRVYHLREVKGSDGQITYDKHSEEIIVYISDDGSENLVCSVEYENEKEGAVFTNTYTKKEDDGKKDEDKTDPVKPIPNDPTDGTGDQKTDKKTTKDSGEVNRGGTGDDGKTKIKKTAIAKTKQIVRKVRTGDPMAIGLILVLLAVAVAGIFFATRRRRRQ